jgi:hypothetical protein
MRDANLDGIQAKRRPGDCPGAGEGKWRMTMGNTLLDTGASNRRHGSIERRLEVLNLKFDVLNGGILLLLGVQAMTLMRLGEISCQIAMMVH